jgi:hypothetical protein
MANPTDAREAFIHEVFGEIVKVEKSVKETAAQVRSMVDELRQSESAISVSTGSLIAAANQLAQGNALVSDIAKDELKWAIDRIETGTANLARAVEPLTDLTLGLREVARDEAHKRTFEFLEKQEKKIDSMLAIMDVFLQQIEMASERLPLLSTPPYKVSQIKEGNIEHLKSGMSLRAMKRDIQNIMVKVLKR